MARTAGKAKTRKAVAKRFKITGTGKILRRKQGKRHLLIKKNAKRKRNLGKAALVSDADAPMVKANMPWG
jgi:large subunit ribosomal protein L35